MSTEPRAPIPSSDKVWPNPSGEPWPAPTPLEAFHNAALDYRLRHHTSVSLEAPPSRIVNYQEPFDAAMWMADCHCGWLRGGYSTEANARRGLSKHQSLVHPENRT